MPDHPIMEKLRKPIQNRLKAAGVTHPHQLTLREALRIPGIGPKAVEEICRVVYGYFTSSAHDWKSE